MQIIKQLITLFLLLQQQALIQTIQPQKPLTQEQAIAVLSVAGWDESLHDEALAIMKCESELIPTAQGDWNYGTPYAIGLFQVHYSYVDEWDCNSVLSGQFVGYGAYFSCSGVFSGNPYNAVDNAILARLVYEKNRGWAMWSCSRVLW